MENQRPHVAFFPWHGMGHLIPLVEFAKRLTLNYGFSVTFIIPKWMTGVSHSQIAYMQGLASSAEGMIQFLELPGAEIEGGHPNMDTRSHLSLLMEKTKIFLEAALRTFPFPLCAFITDIFSTAMFDVTAKLDIPSYIFFTSSASLLCIMLYLPTLLQEIEISFKDVDFPIKVPGLPPIPGRCLPSHLQDRSDIVSFNRFLQHSSRLREARGILINTCHDMEAEQVKALVEGKVLSSSQVPSIYPVGPIVCSSRLESEPHEKCLKWLDGQPASSVLFVAFGSRGTLSDDQIRELALGLEASGQRFLWALRRPPPPSIQSGNSVSTMSAEEDMRHLLPEGFENRTKDRGLVVPSWVPQIPVLSHPSTGGFLSHCGWNSALEGILYGVPLIAWPLVADQKMNAFLLVKEGLAIEVNNGCDGLVSKEEVEKTVRDLMEGDGRVKLKKRARELMEKAKNALVEGGSSYNSMATVAAVWKKLDGQDAGGSQK